LLADRLYLTFEDADLVFPFEKLALVVVFFAGSDTHLVLNVAEVEALFLNLLLGTDKLFSLLIKLCLHVVEVGIQHGDGLFQVLDLLVLGKELSFVSLNIVDKDGFLAFAASFLVH
jgi:hypothetical protein